MIEVQLTTAVAIYSIALAVLFGAIWLYTELSGSHSRNVLEEQNLWHCIFCGYTYLDEAAQNLSRCPRCQSFNAASDKRARFVPTKPEPATVIAEDAELPRRNPSQRKRPNQQRRGPRRH